MMAKYNQKFIFDAYEAGCGTHDGANAMQVFYLVKSRDVNVLIGAVKVRLHLTNNY